MHIEHIVIFAIALFVLIVASKPLADLLKIPEALVLLVLGATAGAFAIKGLGIDHDTGFPFIAAVLTGTLLAYPTAAYSCLWV